MKLVVTTREISYGGRPLSRGDVFEASPTDAYVLKLLGKAADAPADSPAPLDAAPMVDSTRAVAGESADMPKRSRTYKTRDLTAED